MGQHGTCTKLSDTQPLQHLADWVPILSSPDFYPGDWSGPTLADLVLGHVNLSKEALAFEQMAYDTGWVRRLQYQAWSETERGTALLNDPDLVLATATVDELACLLTAVIRQDRFCEGVLLAAFNDGLIWATAERAVLLLQGLEHGTSHP